MLILKQNSANSVPTPPAGKGTIFLDDSSTLSVKTDTGNVQNFPTVGASNSQVVFMDGTSLGGDSDFTWNKNTNVLTINGNVAAGNVKTDNLLYANGSPWDLQQPGGSNTQVQFNDADSFGGSANYVFNKTTNNLTVTGNIIDASGAFYGNATGLSNIPGANVTGQVSYAATANSVAGANVSGEVAYAAVANSVAGANVSGTVANATYATSAGSATTAGTVTTAAQPNITSVGTLSSLAVTGNITSGNFVGALANGNSNVNIPSSNGNVNISAVGNITMVVTGTGANISGTLNASGNANVGNIGATQGVFTNVSGNGSTLSSLTGANVTGQVSYAAVANSVAGANVTGQVSYAAVANSVAGANVTGQVSYAAVANSVAGANVSGQVGNALVAGTVYTNAQPNITSVGTLTSVTVSGNANVANLNATTGVIASTLTSNVATGTAPLTVTSTTRVANLNVATSGVANTVNDAAQPNITSVGTLTSLTVTGNANVGNINPTNLVATGTGSFGGNLNMNTNYINNLGSPSLSSDAATKQYVDDLVSTGLYYHSAVAAATTTTLATTTGGTMTYTAPGGAGNGVGAYLSTTGTFNLIDTVNVQTAGTRILVKNEANATWNGVYVYTNTTAITRSTDTDTYGVGSGDLSENDYFYISGGNVNIGSAYVCNTAGTITFGTTNINFAQFSSSQVYSNGVGLNLSGTQFSLANTAVTAASYGNGDRVASFTVDAQGRLTAASNTVIAANAANLTGTTLASGVVTSSLTAVGTVTTGVWNNNIGSSATFAAGLSGANLASITGANVTGTVANATYAVSAGTAGTVTTAAQPNITSVGTLTSLGVSGAVTASTLVSNVATGTAPFTVTSTTQVANLSVATAGSATTAGTVTTAAQPNITSVGTLTSLGVNGTVTAVAFTANTGVFTGNGSGLSAIAGANVTGTVSAATTAGTVTTAAQPNITSVGTLTALTVTGNVGAGNVNAPTFGAHNGTVGATTANTGAFTTISATGQITSTLATGTAPFVVTSTTQVANLSVATAGSATTAGTVTTAAQPNITSVGTLTGLTVSATITGSVSGSAGTAGTVTTAAQPNITSVSTSFTNLTFANAQTISGNNITLTTGANTNVGTITGNWSLSAGSKLQATYADLAEKYVADAHYDSGTVLLFGGINEVTLSTETDSHRVAGVVSTNPAYVMNSQCEGEHVVDLALTGRVPVKVQGLVNKGDLMVSGPNGHAVANNMARAGTIIGKALENFNGATGIIEVVVGRV